MLLYDFQSRGERYAGCIGQVSKTVAKEVLARKKAEAAEGRYSAPAKKPSPLLQDFVEEYFAYYRANRRPRSVKRHETSWNAIQPVLDSKRLEEISAFDLERHRCQRKQTGSSGCHDQLRAVFSAPSIYDGYYMGQGDGRIP